MCKGIDNFNTVEALRGADDASGSTAIRQYDMTLQENGVHTCNI